MASSGSGFNYDDYPVIVGIDFGRCVVVDADIKSIDKSILGTTFSGCCYAFAQNEEVIDIVKW